MGNSSANQSGNETPLERRLLMVALGLLIVGLIGYFAVPRGPLVFYVFAHVGALGLMMLIGAGVGVLARKKGRVYLTGFLLASALPIAAGLIAVAIVAPPVYCGGSVSLAAAVLVLLGYLLPKRKTADGALG